MEKETINVNIEEKDEWEKERLEMMEHMKKSYEEEEYLQMYSSFTNFPSNIKKNIIFNLSMITGLTIAIFVCVFAIHYFSLILFLTYFLFVGFLGWKTFSVFFYLKHVHFITFTGKIVESYFAGTKLTANKHFVLKLLSDDGKELCFPYYDNQTLNFDQYITLFINKDSEIIASPYGPMIESYIEAVPTEEIQAKLSLFKSKEHGRVNIKEYLKK